MQRLILVLFISLFSYVANSQVVYFDWLEHAGSSLAGSDIGYSIASDDSNYTYITSVCIDSAIFGDTTMITGGGWNCFLTKYNQVGDVVWVRKVHSGGSYPHVACDSDFNVYVCGDFGGPIPGPVQFGDTTLTTNWNQDIYLAKYNSSGDFIWVRQIGGLSDDQCGCVGIDRSDNPFITGYIQDTVLFNDTTIISNSIGGVDSFVAKYDSSGNEIWVKQIGGASPFGHGLAFDSDNNIIATGNYYSYVKIENDSIISQGSSDVYLCKLDTNGNKIWITTAGGSSTDNSRSLAIDSSDNIFIGGSFIQSGNFGSIALTTSGGRDGFLAKYNKNGGIIWVNQIEGNGSIMNTQVWSLATDGYNTYITGWFEDTALVAGVPMISGGNEDIFIAKYDTHGNPKWAKQGSGLSSGFGRDITINKNGGIYITGYFYGLFSFDGDTISPYGSNYHDVFIIKLLEKIPSAIIFQSADTILTNDSIIFSNMSINASSYDWDFGDGFADTLANPVHTYLNSGQYTVRLIAHNSFYSDTTYSQVIVLNGVGVRLIDYSIEGLKLFPNPASENIKISTDRFIIKIEILDMLGKFYPVKLKNQNRIDVSVLPSGNYVLRVTMDEGVISRGFIKQ